MARKKWCFSHRPIEEGVLESTSRVAPSITERPSSVSSPPERMHWPELVLTTRRPELVLATCHPELGLVKLSVRFSQKRTRARVRCILRGYVYTGRANQLGQPRLDSETHQKFALGDWPVHRHRFCLLPETPSFLSAFPMFVPSLPWKNDRFE